MTKRPNLEDYREVPDRIRAFYADHPEGRLLSRTILSGEDVGRTHRFETDEDGQRWVVVVADVFRTATDTHPAGTGTARDPYPGRTPYTQRSEVENAETSAWGRALSAAGYPGKSVASAEEIKTARESDPDALAPEAEVQALYESIPLGGLVAGLEEIGMLPLNYEHDAAEVEEALQALTVGQLDRLRGLVGDTAGEKPTPEREVVLQPYSEIELEPRGEAS